MKPCALVALGLDGVLNLVHARDVAAEPRSSSRTSSLISSKRSIDPSLVARLRLGAAEPNR
jgi:hypothetical protein